MSLNDAVDWSTSLGGGTSRRARPGGHVPDRRRARSSGPCRGSSGSASSSDELDRRPPAAPGAQLPARRDAGRAGPGRDRDRRADRTRRPRAMRGLRRRRRSCRRCERPGFDPATVDVVAMSHLHFDHAGGLLDADGARAFPRATDRRPAGRVGDRPRRQPAARRVATTSPSCGSSATGAPRAGPTASARSCPGVSVVPTGGHSAGHQAIVVRGGGAGGRTLAFFGDLRMRPWSANPRWVTAFDDFPLDSVARQGRAVRAGPPTRAGSSSCRTSGTARSAGSSPTGTATPSRPGSRRGPGLALGSG